MSTVKGMGLIVLVWAWMAGCAAHQNNEARVRGALDIVARVVDPAYGLAVDGCIAKENVIVGSAERGEIPSVEADKLIGEVRSRCHRIRAAFDAIRQAHTDAVRFVEQGAVTEAERQVDRIEQLWTSIKEGAE